MPLQGRNQFWQSLRKVPESDARSVVRKVPPACATCPLIADKDSAIPPHVRALRGLVIDIFDRTQLYTYVRERESPLITIALFPWKGSMPESVLGASVS